MLFREKYSLNWNKIFETIHSSSFWVIYTMKENFNHIAFQDTNLRRIKTIFSTYINARFSWTIFVQVFEKLLLMADSSGFLLYRFFHRQLMMHSTRTLTLFISSYYHMTFQRTDSSNYVWMKILEFNDNWRTYIASEVF